MEEGDNHLLIKFSDVAKLGGVGNPAKSKKGIIKKSGVAVRKQVGLERHQGH